VKRLYRGRWETSSGRYGLGTSSRKLSHRYAGDRSDEQHDYLVSKVGNTATVRLHAPLDLATGNEKFSAPVLIAASVPGIGDGSSGGVLDFDPKTKNQRSGLALAGGSSMCRGPLMKTRRLSWMGNRLQRTNVQAQIQRV